MTLFDTDTHASRSPASDDPDDTLFSQWPLHIREVEPPSRTLPPRGADSQPPESIGDVVADAWFK